MPATPASFDYQPVLSGELLALRPLQADDFEALYAVASDPLIWEQHPVRNRYEPETFRGFFRESLESGGALVAIDRTTGAIIGSSRFYRHDPARSEVEIGWTFLARRYWGGRYNGEMKRLMLQHAFQFVGHVVFLIGPQNYRSQAAIKKIGGVYVGMRPDGRGGESRVFRISAVRKEPVADQHMTALDLIGGTRLVPLRHMVPSGSARILVKLEYENPTGSMKDRMALAMVEAAERDGRLTPGGSVVEYSAGSTGVSLAFVCAAKRIPLQIVTSEAFSREKRDHMRALGAGLTLVPSATGGTTRALTLEMIETARRLAAAPGCYWTDQLSNTDQLAGYVRMADEIREQADGPVTALVQSVGTAGSLRGIATRLRQHDSSVQVVAVEPEESAVLSGRPSGSHKIEGTGAGFVVPLWSEGLADEIQTVSSAEAMATARRLAREEGIFAGTSTGGNVAAAVRVAARLGPGHTVVTIAVDSGMKYLSTPLYGSG